MRALLPLTVVTVLALSACDRTPSFDERYSAASNGVQASANAIEKEVSQQISGARDAERAAAEVPASGNGSTLP